MIVLLDTNTYTSLFTGHARVVRGPEMVLLSSIFAGELPFGAATARATTNRRELDEFLANPYVSFVPVGLVTADRFGRIAAALRHKGRPLPTNDIWLAAHAMESGADLLSFDRHFGEVDGLSWFQPPDA